MPLIRTNVLKDEATECKYCPYNLRISGNPMDQCPLDLLKLKSCYSHFQNEISKIFAGFAKNNERERVKLCEDILEQFFDERISPNISDGIYSRKGGFLQFRNDMDQIERDYHEALGTSAVKVKITPFHQRTLTMSLYAMPRWRQQLLKHLM